MSLRVLLVSYSFPPVGGAGVQRVLKLVKYLPAFDIVPTVLTVANPSVPVTDHSLEKDFPKDLEVLRARTFEPGYAVKKAAWKAQGADAASVQARPLKKLRTLATQRLSGLAKELLVPDPQILWQPAGQWHLAKALLGPKPPHVVVISGPPFSQFLMSPLVRAVRKSALVLDYRDEWSTYRTTYEMMGSSVGKFVGDTLEKQMFRLSHRVTTATEEFRKNLVANFGEASKVIAIPNGYDPEDIPPELPEPPTDKLTLVYAGTLFKLTSIRGLVGAVRRLRSREPALSKKLRIRIYGRVVDTEADMFHDAPELGIELAGYIEHSKVLTELARSHLVLCTLDDVPGVERIYPAKIFELMALGRPTLVLSPDGALARLTQDHHLGDLLPPRDEVRIAEFLEAKLRAFEDGSLPTSSSAKGIERYSRKALAGEFAQVLHEAAQQVSR